MKTDPPPPSTANPEGEWDPGSSRSNLRRSRPTRWIILGTLLVLAVFAYFSARPAWRSIKRLRAQHFLSESQEFVRQEQWTQALERTRAALQVAPESPEVLRHAAQLYGRFGSESALDYYQKLVSLAKATTADREAYAALALALGDTGLAGPLVDDLLESSHPSARTLLIGAEYYAVRRDLSRALELARACVRAEPGNPTNILSLASLLTSSQRVADREEAFEVLWPHAIKDGPFQTRALTTILTAPNAPREDREKVEAILAAKPSRSPQEELLLMDARVSLDPSQRNTVAESVINRFGQGSTEDIAGAASWLNRQLLFQRTLALLPAETSRTNPPLARLRYDALVGAEDFKGAYDFVRTNNISGDPIQVEFLRCLAAIRVKDDAATDSHLHNLLDLARRRPRQLRAVAEFARRNEKPEIANEANQILSRNPREAERAFTALLRTADSQGETWVARDYARKLAALRKTDDGVRLQIAYYDLLLEENIDKAFETAQTLESAKPDDFNRRAVLALAHLRRNEPAQASALVEGQVVTWTKLTPGIRAVVVAVLGGNQRAAAVRRLTPRVPLAQLKPEERELLRPYLTSEPPVEMGVNTPEKPEKL